MMNIGENIRRTRQRFSITQEELSRKAGIKQPTISAIENGVNNPAIETLILISNALGCTVSQLIGQTEPDKSMDPGSIRLLSVFDQLNDDGRQLLIEQAESILSRPSLRKEKRTSSAG